MCICPDMMFQSCHAGAAAHSSKHTNFGLDLSNMQWPLHHCDLVAAMQVAWQLARLWAA